MKNLSYNQHLDISDYIAYKIKEANEELELDLEEISEKILEYWVLEQFSEFIEWYESNK